MPCKQLDDGNLCCWGVLGVLDSICGNMQLLPLYIHSGIISPQTSYLLSLANQIKIVDSSEHM